MKRETIQMAGIICGVMILCTAAILMHQQWPRWEAQNAARSKAALEELKWINERGCPKAEVMAWLADNRSHPAWTWVDMGMRNQGAGYDAIDMQNTVTSYFNKLYTESPEGRRAELESEAWEKRRAEEKQQEEAAEFAAALARIPEDVPEPKRSNAARILIQLDRDTIRPGEEGMSELVRRALRDIGQR